jgi:hypothetical protein
MTTFVLTWKGLELTLLSITHLMSYSTRKLPWHFHSGQKPVIVSRMKYEISSPIRLHYYQMALSYPMENMSPSKNFAGYGNPNVLTI